MLGCSDGTNEPVVSSNGMCSITSISVQSGLSVLLFLLLPRCIVWNAIGLCVMRDAISKPRHSEMWMRGFGVCDGTRQEVPVRNLIIVHLGINRIQTIPLGTLRPM